MSCDTPLLVLFLYSFQQEAAMCVQAMNEAQLIPLWQSHTGSFRGFSKAFEAHVIIRLL